MPVRAVAFDFDLTLADSRDGFFDAHEHARTRLSLPPTSFEASARLIGTPLPLAFARLYPGHDGLVDQYVGLWQARADETMTGLTRMLPGAAETVGALDAAGLALGIVSQKRRYRVEEVLRREGLLGCFKAIVGGDDVAELKPDPRGILMLLERLAVGREDAVYVGDTPIDAEAAGRAGVGFIAVLTGYARPEDFGSFAAAAVLQSVSELPPALRMTTT